MSDEMAAQKEQEVKQQTEAEKQEQEERQKRLMILTIMVDPATMQVAMTPEKNIETAEQMEMVIQRAQRQIEVNTMISVMAALMRRVSMEKKGPNLNPFKK